MDIIELSVLISSIIKWGRVTEGEDNEKEISLRKALVRLYAYCLDISYQFDGNEYPEPLDSVYNDIRFNVENNFPNWGYYNEISDLKIIDAEIILGDAVDDLSDIINDLMRVEWRINNTSVNDALWHLNFSFQNHFEQHLIGLLNYIKNS